MPYTEERVGSKSLNKSKLEHTKERSFRPITLNTQAWLTVMYTLATVFLILNLTAIYLQSVEGIDSFSVNALNYYFDAAREQSVPTLFNTLLLFTSAVLLGLIYRIRKEKGPDAKKWLLLCCIFIFLMIDEATGIHEQLNRYRSLYGEGQSWSYYIWIIPYGLFVVTVGIYMLKFVLRLPHRIKNLVLISGTIYVGAAIGFEVFEGMSSYESGPGNINDRWLTAFEEFFETIGLIVFIKALTSYVTANNVAIIPNSLYSPEKINL